MILQRTVGMILFTAILTSCGGSGDAHLKPVEPVAVSLETVRMSTTPITYEAAGTVRSRLFSTISSKADGAMEALHVREGDLVEAGALLAEIDSRSASAALEQAKAAVSESEHAAEEVAETIKAAEAARDAAEASRQLAEATFNRMRSLSDQSAISRQQFDEAEAKFRAATADARRATDELQAARARQAQVAARAEQARASLEQGDVNYSYTRVTAPFKGKIIRRHVDVGDLAMPGTPLFEIEDANAYRLEVSASEAEISRIRVGDAALARVDVLGTEPVPAAVAEIVPLAEPGSRSFIVKLDLPSHPALRAGMYGKAVFTVGELSTVTVPRTAVTVRGQLERIFVVDDKDMAHMRIVKTGKLQGDRVEILAGLNEGERIVCEGSVSDGQRIIAKSDKDE